MLDLMPDAEITPRLLSCRNGRSVPKYGSNTLRPRGFYKRSITNWRPSLSHRRSETNWNLTVRN